MLDSAAEVVVVRLRMEIRDRRSPSPPPAEVVSSISGIMTFYAFISNERAPFCYVLLEIYRVAALQRSLHRGRQCKTLIVELWVSE